MNPAPVTSRFAAILAERGLPLRRGRPEILQINVGKLCNLTCIHCHVNAGPRRREIMTRETIDRIIDWLAGTDLGTVDVTGGAPEMIPDFRHLITRLRSLRPLGRLLDRCNLSILLDPCFAGTAEFLAEQQVEVVASLPCYGPENVDEQRGEGVFQASIAALQLLNRLGYGRRPELPLHLVYNPNGDFLPGPQQQLETDYKRVLQAQYGITFNSLYTLANLPIARFASWLRHERKYEAYLDLLVAAFNPATVEGLMCRNTISVGWTGEVYDCDFNQMLNLPLGGKRGAHVWDLVPASLEGWAIATGSHCFGCTAGAGSSCGGALTG
ncbi:MAG TPA: arsenosugar biosynthesis radical SAM (seleno)protein ArsS [Chthoniobacterales bacterium]